MLTPLFMSVAGIVLGRAVSGAGRQSRHERCLANIDRMERELGIGEYGRYAGYARTSISQTSASTPEMISA
jgi:hypothetical protein